MKLYLPTVRSDTHRADLMASVMSQIIAIMAAVSVLRQNAPQRQDFASDDSGETKYDGAWNEHHERIEALLSAAGELELRGAAIGSAPLLP